MMNEMSTWKEVGEGAAILFRVIQMQIHDAFLRIVSPIRHMQTERAFRRLEKLCDILKITQDQFVIVHVNSEIGKVRLQIEQLHTRCLQDAEEAEAAKNRIEAWMRRHEARKRMEARDQLISADRAGCFATWRPGGRNGKPGEQGQQMKMEA